MAMGGGYMGQMDSFNYNRDLLRKTKRKPFDKDQLFNARPRRSTWTDNAATDEDLQLIQARAKWENQRSQFKSWVVLGVSSGIVAIIAWAVFSIRF